MKLGISQKNFFKQIVPPLLLSRIRWVKGMLGIGLKFSGDYHSWKDALANSSGYDTDEILHRVEAATSLVVSGVAAYERDSVLFDQIPHSYPVLAGLLRAAVENGHMLTVLDFGGSLGSSYRQCKGFLSVIHNLEWLIVEQEQFVRCGRERFETNQLRFYSSLQEAVADRKRNVDVVLLSSVLQYLETPYETLKELYDIGCRYLIIDITPLSDSHADRLVVQRVPPNIYSATYPCWIFSREQLIKSLKTEWEELTAFPSADGSWLADGVNFEFGGIILQRRNFVMQPAIN